MSGNKLAFSLLGRLLAIAGGIWGGALAIGTMFQQLDLGAVLRGELSLDVAFRMGGNALPFIVTLFLLCSMSIWLAASSSRALGWTSIAWTAIGGILLYGVYLARFSLGLLLLPSAGLILFAGLVTFARWLVTR